MYSWVGYYDKSPVNNEELPPIKKGVYTPADSYRNKKLTAQEIQQSNLNYARNYKIYNDLIIIFKGFIN